MDGSVLLVVTGFEAIDDGAEELSEVAGESGEEVAVIFFHWSAPST